MITHTEIKCYSCSRVCGEVEGRYPSLGLLSWPEHMTPGIGCGIKPNKEIRCSRCGSRVYLGDSYTEVAYERPFPVAS